MLGLLKASVRVNKLQLANNIPPPPTPVMRTTLSTSACPQVPPIELQLLTPLEKHLIRAELAQLLARGIETAARLAGFDDLPAGPGHIWSELRVSPGKGEWENAGRLYRKCWSATHHEQNLPCATALWVTPPLQPRFLEEITSLRILYDALGPPWCRDVEFNMRECIQVLWQQREQTTVNTLRAAFQRLLDDVVEMEEVENEVIIKDEDEP
ncbi:hypothetical protein VNI00_015039 [Paramarasmius palmivorus]|uniref:Uncharacterized protein n=1 Tax=Paramarasmius palmivorus TaxID=297713 RepID=A0AAW0BNW9_9AGAR